MDGWKGEVAKGELTGGWKRVFPQYTSDQLFTLVSDVESYPHFIPGCVAARVVGRTDNRWRVDNVFHVGPVRSRFESIAQSKPPNLLVITTEDGPWKRFRLQWKLDPEGKGCHVSCDFIVAFRSKALAAVARLGLGELDRRIIAAFEKQAVSLYG